MDGRRTSRGVARCALALVVCLLWAGKAGATFRYGDIQISGNIQTQNLFRIQNGTDTFHAFDPVQQRRRAGRERAQFPPEKRSSMATPVDPAKMPDRCSAPSWWSGSARSLKQSTSRLTP